MIAVIAAMDAEVNAITAIMAQKEEIQKASISFYQGKLCGKTILVMKSGVGKGNAAMATTVLLTQFAIDKVVNIGTAGGLNAKQQILDAVVSDRVVQHDFDTSAIDGKTGIGLYFDADPQLKDECMMALQQIGARTHHGVIASGDQFIAHQAQLDHLLKRFPDAICAEMEAGAIAQVCSHYKVPFVVLRSLSDIACASNSHMDFATYVTHAAKRSAKFMDAFMQLDTSV